MSRLDHEKEPEILHQLVEELRKAKGDSSFQQLRLAALERQLAKLTKQVFGPSSEQRTTEDKPAGGDGDDQGQGDGKKKKRSGHGPTKQPKLPVIEVEHPLEDADRVCPNCGGGLHEMEGQYEESDEIDVLPLRF